MPSHYFKKFSKTYLLLCAPILEIGVVVGTLLATHEAMDGAAGGTARDRGCLIRQVGSSGFGTEVSNGNLARKLFDSNSQKKHITLRDLRSSFQISSQPLRSYNFLSLTTDCSYKALQYKGFTKSRLIACGESYWRRR